MSDRNDQNLLEATIEEKEVLGSVISVPENMRFVQSLSAEDFSIPEHRVIWRAISRLFDEKDEITPRAICALGGDELSRVPRDYVSQLAERASGSIGLITAAVERVLDAARRRRLVEVLAEARRNVTTSDEKLDAIIARTSNRADRAALGHRSAFMSGKQAAERLGQQLKNPGRRLKTGLTKLDYVLGGGLARSRMVSIIAKPKVGKTTLISTISYNLTEQKIPHLVISLERTETDMEMLKAARSMGISSEVLESKFDVYEQQFRAYGEDRARDFCQYLHLPGATLDEIRYAILRAHRLHKIEAFLLDYYQLVERPPREPTIDHLSRVAQTLANMTASLKISSVVAAQSDQDGMPRDCKVLWHAAAVNFVIRRATDQPETWLENIGSNSIGPLNVGGPGAPALIMDTSVGPHFRNA